MLLSEEELDFRATRDIDMVLIVEALTSEFADAFWSFIRNGGYSAWTNKEGKAKFYRFTDPKDINYPFMIEIFARPDSDVDFSFDGTIIPIHVDENISSLSAILLNDDYYKFILEGRNMSGEVTILDAEHIIPLKMKAWLDLNEQKNNGQHVNDRDIRKHRQDVFRLYALVRPEPTINVSPQIYDDIQAFISAVKESGFDPKTIHVNDSKEVILDTYSSIYRVSE